MGFFLRMGGGIGNDGHSDWIVHGWLIIHRLDRELGVGASQDKGSSSKGAHPSANEDRCVVRQTTAELNYDYVRSVLRQDLQCMPGLLRRITCLCAGVPWELWTAGYHSVDGSLLHDTDQRYSSSVVVVKTRAWRF